MFGDNLLELRKESGYDPKEAGGVIGRIVPHHLVLRARAQPANHEMLIRIAELFDVSLDYLLGLRRDRVSYKEQNNVIVVPKSLPKREYPKIEEYIQFLLSHQDKNG